MSAYLINHSVSAAAAAAAAELLLLLLLLLPRANRPRMCSAYIHGAQHSLPEPAFFYPTVCHVEGHNSFSARCQTTQRPASGWRVSVWSFAPTQETQYANIGRAGDLHGAAVHQFQGSPDTALCEDVA